MVIDTKYLSLRTRGVLQHTSHNLSPCDEARGDGRVDVAARHVSQALGQRGNCHPETESDPHILGLGGQWKLVL